jgi:hypothetical protein
VGNACPGSALYAIERFYLTGELSYRPIGGFLLSSRRRTISSVSSINLFGAVPCLQVRRGPSTSLGFSPNCPLVPLGLTEQSVPLHLGIRPRQLLGAVDDCEGRMHLPPLSSKRQIPTHAWQVFSRTGLAGIATVR